MIDYNNRIKALHMHLIYLQTVLLCAQEVLPSSTIGVNYKNWPKIFGHTVYMYSVDIEGGVKGILITFPRQRDKETKRQHEFDMGRYERGSEIENRVSKRDIARKRRRDRV